MAPPPEAGVTSSVDREKIRSLRERVEAQPHDQRGMLARELFAEVERAWNERQASIRAQLESICRKEYLSDEDVAKVLAAHDRGETVGFEEGDFPCPACGGKGSEWVPGCIGGRLEECGKCHGRRKVHFRVKVPA